MNILAIDPGTITGWAHSCGESGVWDLALKKDESQGMKYVKFRGKLSGLLSKHPIDVIVYEAPRGFGFQRTLVAHSKWCGVIEEFCASNASGKEIQCKGYVATFIKKKATGNGRASKEEMIEKARTQFERDIKDDNHADALWLLYIAQKEFDGS